MLSLKDFLNGVSVVSNKTERGNMKITITKDLDKAQEVLFLGLFEEDKDNKRSLGGNIFYEDFIELIGLLGHQPGFYRDTSPDKLFFAFPGYQGIRVQHGQYHPLYTAFYNGFSTGRGAAIMTAGLQIDI